MKEEIIILSDLWGINKSEWFVHFERMLSGNYYVKFYDSCKLGEIDLTPYEEKNIHKQFVKCGIEKASNKLLILEKQPKIYIGCSVGGVILWKAGLKGLPVKKLITISATRLRKEKEKPNCSIKTYFGELDEYKPKPTWFELVGKDANKILKGNHEIYKNKLSVAQIINDLNNEKWIDLR